MEDIQEVNEVVVPIIGEFKPKKKFLNFVAGVSGAKIRLISDIAFIKGEKLSGLGLENVIFKVTICDEGTINFDEVDTNVTDNAYRQRLIDDIASSDVTGYTNKFIISGLEFADKDGSRCYLEIDEAKPIDKLKSLFPDEPVVSSRGLSFLDELLGDSSDEVSDNVEVVEDDVVNIEVSETKNAAQLLMEESFKKMNDDKINELKIRIEDEEAKVKKAKVDISSNEKKLKDSSDKLRVLTTRLETMSPPDESNGFVFLVSDIQKPEAGLDESNKEIVSKIADIMSLKKDVLFDYLTEGFFKITIGKKGDNQNKLESIDRELLEKITPIDPMGKFTMSDTNMVEYRGELNWHQLVAKMIRKGFEQDEEFDKISGSNSYESKTEDDGGSYTGTKDESSHVCGEGCDHKSESNN